MLRKDYYKKECSCFGFPAHSMFKFDVFWALVSSWTQVWPQLILSLDYLPDYLSVSYDYDYNAVIIHSTGYYCDNVDSTQAIVTDSSWIVFFQIFVFIDCCNTVPHIYLLL